VQAALVLGAAAAGLAGGLLVPAALPGGYQATTSVLVHPLEGNPYGPSTQGSDLVNLETEAQVAGSDAVVAAVEDQLADGTGRSDLARGIQVTVGSNTQVLDLTYGSSDPDQAAEVAELFAATYLQHRSDQRDAFVEGRQAALDVRIQDLNRRLTDLRAAGVGNEDPQVKALGGQLLNLSLQSSSATAADSSPGQVLVSAQSSERGVHLPTWFSGLTGLGIGLLAGLAVVVARDRRSDLVRGMEDVELLGVPVLAEEREEDGGGGTGTDGDGVPVSFAASTTARVLRRQATDPRSVAVGGVGAAEAGPRGPRELAEVLARHGERTLLIDGHDRGNGEEGMSEILLRGRPFASVVGSGGTDLDVLTAGQQPDRAAALYATSRMTQLLDDASAAFTWVVVDAPAAGTSVGRALIASCRYWVPVISVGRTTRADVVRALAWADSAGVTVVGCVLVPARRHGRPVVVEADLAGG
jgi:hypothetical protein